MKAEQERVEAQRQQLKQELVLARTEWSQRARELTSVSASLRQEFENSQEHRAAREACARAQAAYDEACAAVRQRLLSRVDYQADLKAQAAARRQLADARQSSGSDPEMLAALAGKAFEADGKVKAIENDAFARDPKVDEARDRLRAAQSRLREMERQFEKALPQAQPLRAAREAVDLARSKMLAAERDLARQ